MIWICNVTDDKEQLAAVRSLFTKYAMELGEDLQFQGFDEELADPLKKYGPPHGGLLVALVVDTIVGCVALQRLEPTVCEMKRLYVLPKFRCCGIGDELVKSLLLDAEEEGYKTMVLDTLERLRPAIRLYKRHGFVETKAYYSNPLPGVVYMEKQLKQ